MGAWGRAPSSRMPAVLRNPRSTLGCVDEHSQVAKKKKLYLIDLHLFVFDCI